MPIMEIAAALKRRGHDVSLCVPPLFRREAERRGLDASCYDEDSEDVMRRLGMGWEAGRQALRWFTRSLEAQLETLMALSEGADALVTSVNEIAAPTVAEHRGIAHFRVAYTPALPGSQPPPMLPWQNLPASANRLIWKLLNAGLLMAVGKTLNGQRRKLGLEPVRDFGAYCAGRCHTILAFSPTLGPPQEDWKFTHTYSGYCHGRDRTALGRDLERFLEGPPPLYVGFGSVSFADPESFTRKILDAANMAGCRLILGSGWAGLGRLPHARSVFVAGDTPHAKLFPLLAGSIHHGGCGTTHSAMAAGIPQLVMPQLADQFYWGRRVHELGLGPRPVPPHRVTLRKLADLMRDLMRNPAYRSRARILQEAVRHDDGVSRAVRIITGSMQEAGARKSEAEPRQAAARAG